MSIAGPVSSELVWDDPLPFERLFEQRARVLVAIQATISDRRPLGGREAGFLALYEFVRRIDERIVGRVWASPAAHAWSRRTFDALGTCLADPDNKACADRLAAQLDAFAYFALSVAHLAGTDLELPQPIEVDRAVNLPGTNLVIEGQGPVTRGGSAGMDLVGRPSVLVDGADVGLVPEALDVPGARWPDVGLSLAAGADFHRAYAAVVRRTLECVGRHQPKTFIQIRDQIDVVALQPEDACKYPNASSSEFPGAVLLGANDDPLELADHLVHEVHHNRLFALEGMGALLRDDAPDCYYSPWREELRSMRGLIHGAYVFVPVHDFWRSVAQSAIDVETRGRALDHATRIALELDVALGLIRRHASLTDFGREIVRHLGGRIDEISDQSGGAASDTVRAAVRAHVRRFDVGRQVVDRDDGA